MGAGAVGVLFHRHSRTLICLARVSTDTTWNESLVIPSVTFNGAPIDPLHTYTVAINNYMYQHPPTGWTWTDANPLTSTVLCRDGIVEFAQQFTAANPYHVGGPRYELNTEFSGQYRAVVTMMNGVDTRPSYEDAFIRFLTATPETLQRRGTPQVPASLVNEDGTVNSAHRLSEQELYRSSLGFKQGVLHAGDIIEVRGKGSFFGGNPEFVDQEGIYGDGIEFNIVGHDTALAKPVFMESIESFVPRRATPSTRRSTAAAYLPWP
jgi:2',3'-cyclic-nucleotide 2'-phosphodiesterase/3'-nucleotidase/5'-nucleotidase